MGRLVLFRRAPETEVAERFLVIKQQPIKESVLRIDSVTEYDETELGRANGCQGGVVRGHVQQAAADNDGMAYSEGFEGRCQEHAAANIWLYVQVIRAFEIVNHRFEAFIDLAWRSRPAEPFHAIGHVIFSMTIPAPLHL